MKEKAKEIQMKFPKENDGKYIEEAVELVNHYNSQGLMLPVTELQYKELANSNKLLVAVTPDNDVVGTLAYTYAYPREIWELGGLAVKEGWLHQGIATVLIKGILKSHPHYKTIAIANKNSTPLLKQLGAQDIRYPNTLPSEIFGPCAKCPVKPETGCCDTLLSLAPIVLNLAYEWMSIRQTERLIWGISEKQSSSFAGAGVPAEEW